MKNEVREISTTRRQLICGLSAGVALAGAGLIPLRAVRADEQQTLARIKALIGDRKVSDGRISLDAPEIAENGNTVPIAFSIDSPMTQDDHVTTVHVFAEGNPSPDVATFRFTPMSGVAAASTRIRMAKTQNIVVLAEMSDGSVYRALSEVKVTIGGCGG